MMKVKIKFVDVRNNVVDDVENIDELIDYLDDYVEKGNVREVLVVVK
jgi:hypothetical protein